MQTVQSDWLSNRTLSAISVQWLEVVYEMATFFSFVQNFEGTFLNKWIIKLRRSLKGGHLQFFKLKKLEIFEHTRLQMSN